MSERPIRGSVLEVGAVPSDSSLLCMKSLQHASSKIGINLDSPHNYQDFKIVRGNANSMDCFQDNLFDAVLCNATLEHDKYFWKTLQEIRRGTKPVRFVILSAAFVILSAAKDLACSYARFFAALRMTITS